MLAISEEELIALLANPAEFQRVITNGDVLGHVFRVFPTYADKLLECITLNPILFDHFITNLNELNELLYIANLFSNPELFKKNLNNILKGCDFLDFNQEIKERYNKFINDKNYLIETGQPFPDHITPIVTVLTADSERFQRLITSNDDLVKLADTMQEHARMLFFPILSTPEKYPYIIRNFNDFSTLTQKAPYTHLIDQFLMRLTRNRIQFMRLITSPSHLLCLLEIAKQLADPQTFAAIITLTLDDEKYQQEPEDIQSSFKAVVQHRQQLTESGQAFPDYIYRIAIQLFSDHERFLELTQSIALEIKKMLTDLAPSFPKNTLLQSSSVNEIADKIKAYENARDHASTLGHSIRNHTSFFSRLDPPTLAKIVCHTVDEKLTNPEVLNRVINRAFNKPVMPTL